MKKRSDFAICLYAGKKNRSGSISIVVIDKSNGKFREVKTLGTSSDISELEKLYVEGKRWIASILGERDMFAEQERNFEEKQATEYLLSNIENILLNGTQLILNPVKGTLELRPMFHFTPKRIEVHVCICFIAYKVYKELERIL
jgi:hypothetical protein